MKPEMLIPQYNTGKFPEKTPSKKGGGKGEA
jgi:hypothetical protein